MNSHTPFRRQHKSSSPLYYGPKRCCRIQIGVLLGCTLLLGLTGCNPGSSGSTGSGSPPTVTVASVSDLGTLPTNPDILGRDEAYSTAFQGYSVWVYGDTFFQNPDASGRTLLSNTWSYTADFDASNGITGFQERLDRTGSPSMLIQETPTEYQFNLDHYGNNCLVQPCGQRWAIWPSSLLTDPVTNQALVFYTVINVDPNGNFQGVGSSVAIWPSFDQLPQRPNFNPPFVAGHPDLMFDKNAPSFGSTAVISNGVLYIYGCDEDTNGLDKGCRIAKVDPAAVQDRSTWTFYDGSNWSTSVNSAVPVFDGLDILSVSWNGYLREYVAVYAGLFSNDVMIRTSPAPEGPWSDEIKMFTAVPPVGGGYTYDAQAHQEYDGNGGQTIYVTYSRATGSFSSEVHLVSVGLQKSQ